ncbi:unnamed protein product [Pylaiella littoralis]
MTLSTMTRAKAAPKSSGAPTAGRSSLILLALIGNFAVRECFSFVSFCPPKLSVARVEAQSSARRRSHTVWRGDQRGIVPPESPGKGGKRYRRATTGVSVLEATAAGGEETGAPVGAAAGEGGGEQRQEDGNVDVVVIGAGIGGLTCAALLAQYGLDVTVCESHTIPGGCAHSFERDGYKFDSGPSIFSGFTGPVLNPLKQVLNVLEEELPCIRYDGWGNLTPSGYFKFDLGPDAFRDDVLKRLGGPESAQQFDRLLAECQPLMEAASALPSLSLRSDKWAAVTMARFLPALLRLIPLADELNGPFTPKDPVTDSFLFNWLDLLAFSLSGLKAEGTSCASMAYVLADLHREGAKLDYPIGGSGAIVNALVRGLEKNGGTLRLGTHVEQVLVEGNKAVGVRLRGKGGGMGTRGRGRSIRAKRAVVMNADRWAAAKLLPEGTIPEEKRQEAVDTPKTMSFMHLHLGIEGSLPPGTDPHYTVVNRWNDTLGEQNMMAVSIPTLLDSSLAPPGHHIIHAYAAANEPYERWEGMDRRSEEYKSLKEKRAESLWKAVERIVPDARKMAKTVLIGSPLTHERFNRRSYGTYGPAFEDGAGAFPNPVDIPLDNFYSCGDCVFPGVGVPAVAVSGANVANSCVGPFQHLRLINRIQEDSKSLQEQSA